VGIEALLEQIPGGGRRFVELENAVGGQMDEHGAVAEPPGQDVRGKLVRGAGGRDLLHVVRRSGQGAYTSSAWAQNPPVALSVGAASWAVNRTRLQASHSVPAMIQSHSYGTLGAIARAADQTRDNTRYVNPLDPSPSSDGVTQPKPAWCGV